MPLFQGRQAQLSQKQVLFASIIDGLLIGQKKEIRKEKESLLPFLSSALCFFVFVFVFLSLVLLVIWILVLSLKEREMTGKLATKLHSGVIRRKAS